MKKKTIFHEFHNGVYPSTVTITITNNLSSIANIYLNGDGTEITDLPEQCDALCFEAVKKDGKERTDIIIFRDKKYMTVSTMAHESFHATQNLCGKYGITCHNGDNNEAFAYLLGRVVDCCEQVRTNKFK